MLPLYTPAAAAQLLAVRESWLRRRAAARAVPCTFLGRHLRFSRADLEAIAQAAAQPPLPAPVPAPGRQPDPLTEPVQDGEHCAHSLRDPAGHARPVAVVSRRRGPNKASRERSTSQIDPAPGRAA